MVLMESSITFFQTLSVLRHLPEVDFADQPEQWTYRKLLAGALRFRWTMVLLTIAVVVCGGWFSGQIGKGFLPVQDEGRFLVSFKTPLGSSIEYTAEKLQAIERVLTLPAQR